jgi:hypothetical protein
MEKPCHIQWIWIGVLYKQRPFQQLKNENMVLDDFKLFAMKHQHGHQTDTTL